MTGRPNSTPIPSDWADRCATMGVHTIRKHYRVGTSTIARWSKTSGISPLMSRNSPRYEPPADFRRFAGVEHNDTLAQRYTVSSNVISRWRKVTGIKSPPQRIVMPDKKRHLPADFAAIAPTMTRAQLYEHYGVAENVVRRWVAESGVQPRPTTFTRRPVAALPVSIIPQADASLAGQAAMHLRRLMPVFKAAVLDRKRTGYVVGGRQMATEDMIAMAQAKGFDPAAWARI